MTFDYFLRDFNFLKSELLKSKGIFIVKMSCEVWKENLQDLK